MGCPVCGACYGCPGGLERRLALERWLVVQKKGAMMRSNAPLHARKSCPSRPGEQGLRWYGVTMRSARADVSPEADETSGRRLRIRGIPGG